MRQEHMTARATDPETSHEAADSVRPLLRPRQLDVLAAFREYGALTDNALIAIYNNESAQRGWRSQSESGIRTRRSELVKLGLVRNSGFYNRTKSNRRTIVWEVVR